MDLGTLQIICGHFLQYMSNNAPEVTVQWECILKLSYPEYFNAHMTLNDMMFCLIQRSFFNREMHPNGLHSFVEFFAGCGSLSKELLSRGLQGCAFDITYDASNQNCLSGRGFRLYLTALSSLSADGLCWLGTQCSSFVVLCRSVTKRRPDNRYYGDCSNKGVAEGNTMQSMSAMLFFLAWATGCRPALEQPLNSCMPNVPAMYHTLRWVRACKTTTYMGAFNGPSCKPLQIWSTHAKSSALIRDKPDMCGAAEPLVTRSENGQFTGRGPQLVDSGCYTAEFSKAIADAFCP